MLDRSKQFSDVRFDGPVIQAPGLQSETIYGGSGSAVAAAVATWGNLPANRYKKIVSIQSYMDTYVLQNALNYPRLVSVKIEGASLDLLITAINAHFTGGGNADKLLVSVQMVSRIDVGSTYEAIVTYKTMADGAGATYDALFGRDCYAHIWYYDQTPVGALSMETSPQGQETMVKKCPV